MIRNLGRLIIRTLFLLALIAIMAGCQMDQIGEETNEKPVNEQEEVRGYTVSDYYINKKWNDYAGGPTGFLGYPTNNTTVTPNGKGVYNRFEFQSGHIYRKYGVAEAFAVYGKICAKYGAKGWENSFLGFPITDELDTYNRTGRFNHFEGGTIHYKWGASQAYETHGNIRSFWSWNGWEAGHLGFPTSDESRINKKYITWVSNFENGRIFSTSSNTWPQMSVAKGSARGPGMPYITAYFTYYQLVGYYSLRVYGYSFRPGDKVKVSISTYWGPKVFNATKTVNSSGQFTFNSLDIYNQAENEYITTVNGVATVFARVDGGKEIAIWSGRTDAQNSKELVIY